MCLDFLPLYFSLDTEVSIGYGTNELHWAPPYVFRLLLTSALLAMFKVKCHINGALFCPHTLMKHFDYSVLTYSQLRWCICLFLFNHCSYFDYLLAEKKGEKKLRKQTGQGPSQCI